MTDETFGKVYANDMFKYAYRQSYHPKFNK